MLPCLLIISIMLFICCTKFHLWTLSASKCMNSRFRNVRVHLMSVIHICACVEFIYRLRYIYHNIMFSLTHGTTCTLHFSQSYLQFEQYISNNSEPPTPETDNPLQQQQQKWIINIFFLKLQNALCIDCCKNDHQELNRTSYLFHLNCYLAGTLVAYSPKQA